MPRRLPSVLAVLILTLGAFFSQTSAASAGEIDVPDWVGPYICDHPHFAHTQDYEGRKYWCDLLYVERLDATTRAWHWKWEDVTDKYREIHRSSSGLCMNVRSGSSANGAAVVQTSCSQSDHSQWWAQLGSYYGFGVMLNYHSGKCAALNSGNYLVLQPCNIDEHSQLWAKFNYGGVWKFQDYHTGTALTVPGGYTSSNQQLEVYPDHGYSYQRWAIDPLV